MGLQDELRQIREQARTGAGVPTAEQRYGDAQQHYERLLGGRGTFKKTLAQEMQERDVRGRGIQEELRGVRAGIPQIRPQMLAKYGAPGPGAMPTMRPEDITALIAGKETGKETTAQRLQDLYTRHAGTIEDVIKRAVEGYDIEAQLAGTRAEAAERAVERALTEAGATTEMGWEAVEARRAAEREAAAELAERTWRTGEAERQRGWEAGESEKERALRKLLTSMGLAPKAKHRNPQEKLRMLMEDYSEAVSGWGETGKMTREQFAVLAAQDPEIGETIPLSGEGGILWHTQQFWPETGTAGGGTYLREWERPAELQAQINQVQALIIEGGPEMYRRAVSEFPELAPYLDYPTESPEDMMLRQRMLEAMGQGTMGQ